MYEKLESKQDPFKFNRTNWRQLLTIVEDSG